MYQRIKDAQQELSGLPQQPMLPKGGIGAFLHATTYALKLSLVEKEVWFFAFMQWISISLVYMLWLQGFRLLPESLWGQLSSDGGAGWLVHTLVLVWGLLCIALASIPVGFFTGCMGAVHFLVRQNRESTIANCMKVSMQRAAPLSAFHFIDGCITVRQLLSRADTEGEGTTVASEALYYTWKLAVAGMLPAILTGHGQQVVSNAVAFVRGNLSQVLLLRGGYSALCWILGVITFATSVAYGRSLDISYADGAAQALYAAYSAAGVPALAGVAILMLFLRPIYVLSMCELFSRDLEARQLTTRLPPTPTAGLNASVMLIAGAVGVLSAALFLLLAIAPV